LTRRTHQLIDGNDPALPSGTSGSRASPSYADVAAGRAAGSGTNTGVSVRSSNRQPVPTSRAISAAVDRVISNALKPHK
jgi:hypothetical protein